MPRIKYSAPRGSGGTAVSDIPYGASWDGITTIAPSKNAVYDRIQLIGYVTGNIAYQNPIGGNDSTAVIGNRLRPFLTIGAAITALGILQNSALYLSSGYNYLDDTNAVYGLKSPGSYYDIIAEPGCKVDYYGSYGLYISNASTFGGVYGYLDMNAYSSTYTGSVDGVNNYAYNIGVATTPKKFECINATNQNTNTSSGNFRLGTCTGTALTINNMGRIASRGGITFFCDAGSRLAVDKINLLQNVSVLSGMLKIYNPTDLQLRNISNTQAYANFNGCSQPYLMQITDNVGTGNIKFDNCNFTPQDVTDATFKVIEIISSQASLPNLEFKRCDVQGRFSTLYSKAGYSFYTASNISFKGRDTYYETPIGGAGTITNLISSGNGLMYEPNL